MALTTLLDAIERLPAFVRLLSTVPTPGERRTIGGLPGSADASILAALARRLTNRFFVVATESVTEAERWLADLGTLVDETPVALYPPREGFGEAEPHGGRRRARRDARAPIAGRHPRADHHGAGAPRANPYATGAARAPQRAP